VSDPTDTVKVEFRDDICVVRCTGPEGTGLADDLRAQLELCRLSGARDVLLDVESCLLLGQDEIAVLSAAAGEFRAGGGELVVAVEDAETRRALAEAGLVRAAVPASPGKVLAGKAVASLPLTPRWQHDFFFPAVTEEIPGARRRVTALAEVARLGDPQLFEFTVAVAEALTNAVLHGSPHGPRDDVRVRFFCFDDEVAVEIVDTGPGIAASPICSPPTTQGKGRGIHFMRALCDAVQFACTPLGTHVLLVKRYG
jgi:anti-sigma regulatory factor (Ser/Thr protein kinase)